jgi:hypothetical protein
MRKSGKVLPPLRRLRRLADEETDRAIRYADVSVGEILEGALALEPGRWSRADQMRVTAYLKTKAGSAIRCGLERDVDGDIAVDGRHDREGAFGRSFFARLVTNLGLVTNLQHRLVTEKPFSDQRCHQPHRCNQPFQTLYVEVAFQPCSYLFPIEVCFTPLVTPRLVTNAINRLKQLNKVMSPTSRRCVTNPLWAFLPGESGSK